MTVTLTLARTRVRTLVDDPIVTASAGVRYTNDDVDDALKTAFFEVYGIATDGGSNLFQVEGQVTASGTGLASLTTLAPKRVVAAAIQQGANRIQVPAMRTIDVSTLYQRSETLVVTYVPRVVFPVNPGDSFIWGQATIDLPQLDKLMIAIAASELKIVDAEVLQGLEKRKEELVAAVMSLGSSPSWTVLPMTPPRRDVVRYLMTGFDQLQLCYG